jgi:Ni/Fe-hydrogenase subunit HybB-like protein
VVLALFHQATLGAIYYLMAGKLDTLWWSSMLPVFFLLSSFFVGIAMIAVESSLAEKSVGHKVETSIFSRLIKIAAVVLILYLVLKIIDLAIAGEFGNAFAFDLTGNMFLLELVIGIIVPVIIAFTPAVKTKGGILSFSLLVLAGVLLNRFNVVFTGMADYLNASGGSYFPSWQEFVISFGLVALACIGYLFIVENFNVLSHHKGGKTIETGKA